MENKFSCNVINDLLPSYIDGICSEESKRIVEDHLQNCPSCKETYRAMCSEEAGVSASSSPAAARGVSGRTSSLASKSPVQVDEAKIMKKVNRKWQRARKVNIVAFAVAGVLLIALALMFIRPTKAIPKGSYEVKYTNYDLHDFILDPDYIYQDTSVPDKAVMVYETGKKLDDCNFVTVLLGRMCFAVDLDYMEKYPDVCLIEYTSDYPIVEYNEVVKEKDGKNLLYVKSLRTPIFGGGLRQGSQTVFAVEFCHVDEVAE